jgi:hypothetical protein
MMVTVLDFPYKELILHDVPLPPTPARVLTAAVFMLIVAVKLKPSS